MMSRLAKNINIIRTDFNGYFFKAVRLFRLYLMLCYGNLTTKIMLVVKKITIGKRGSFYGKAYFSRYPTSTIHIGKNCTFRNNQTSNLIGVNRKCMISTQYKKARIVIGDNCGFSGVTIGAFEKVIIGDNLICGANVIISDYDWHNTDPAMRYEMCTNAKPVVIENNVFIGVNSIIWKGVVIGENSVIGANSVVTKSIPANVFAAGNPCKVIRPLFAAGEQAVKHS
jgi:acetyltransferase-like isoleucine patch superfamily enzyme